jgi:hypothetical protein
VKEAIRVGRVKVDGTVVKPNGQTLVTKAAIEQVWYLPGIAERFQCSEQKLRQALFKETNMMYPELLTRTDIKLFLPPSKIFCFSLVSFRSHAYPLSFSFFSFFVHSSVFFPCFLSYSWRSDHLYVG